MKPESSITSIMGIGEKTETLFQKVGVFTIGDILLHFPQDYIQYPQICMASEPYEEEICAIMGKIKHPVYLRQVKGMQLVTTMIEDHARKIHLTWFRQPYMKNILSAGEQFIFYGKLKKKQSEFVMEQPAVYTEELYQVMIQDLQPVYTTVRGLSNKSYQHFVKEAIESCEEITDDVPRERELEHDLIPYDEAVRIVHFPHDLSTLKKAHDCIAYHEFYQFLLQLAKLKEGTNKEEIGIALNDDGEIEHYLKLLPYELTTGQADVWGEIKNDLMKAVPMQRLLQGDVGCGKTIIAFLAMILAAKNGYQSALMVPTEVLARQHEESLHALLERFQLQIPVYLLTGSTSAKDKKQIKKNMMTQQNAMIIGTHALIQEDCQYANLAVVITDEQHRFGVRQREKLEDKGSKPHILVMSATPIPRTLAIILYGDLSISSIYELPGNRKPIKNCVVHRDYYQSAVHFIEQQVAEGHQAYVICPLVDESESIDAANAIEETKRLKKLLSEAIRVECLHGKMKPSQKNKIMEDFAGGEIDVLVSTTVIEVGVNVPNATVMMVESAERFGLAQLHQLRGRVGRGNAQSYCIFMNYDRQAKRKNERLEILSKSNNGFEIAQKDLELRGPGDLFGIRQSGEVCFQFADIYQDSHLLTLAANDINAYKREGVNK